MRSLRKILLALAGGLVLTMASWVPVLADVGALEVTVYEVNDQGEQENVLDGARVIVKSVDGAVERAAVTIDGQTTFAGLPQGKYKVNVMMPGYGQVGLDADVLPGRVNQLAVGMRPQKKEEVTVRAGKDVVELEKGGQTETTITEDFFDSLPVLGREYQSVLTLAPGVQDDDGDGNPNVHGARERDFRMTVDGVSNVDPLTGQFQSFVNADAIEEIQVVDSGADASYGGATGGFGKIITKSGSNEFEGTFNLFLSDSAFDGDRAGNREPTDFGLIRPSIFLAGPLVKDHLWYVINHEYIDLKAPVDLIGGDSFVQKQTSFRSMDKITWQVDRQNKLSFQYSADPIKVDPAGVSSVAPPETGVVYEQGGPTYLLKWTAPYSPTFFWEATVAFSDISSEFHPVDRNAKNSCVSQSSSTTEPFRELTCFDDDRGGMRSGAFDRDFKDKRQRWTYGIDAEQFVQEWMGGSHRLKFGGLIENVRYDRIKIQRNFLRVQSRVSLPGVIGDPGGGGGGGTTGGGDQDLFITRFARKEGIEDIRENGARGNYYHAYISDTFEPASNLTITAGVRFFREEMSAPGYTPFDPRDERRQWEEYLDECENFFIGLYGRPVGPSACLARFLKGSALNPTPVPSNPNIVLPVGSGFTYHPFDLPPEGEPCLNARCRLLQQAAGFPYVGELDVANARPAEIFDVINNNLEPRLSIAWDPFNDGKTKIAANWGRFHNQTFLLPLVDEADSDSAQTLRTLRSDGSISTGARDYGWSVRAIDRNLRSQANDEWGLSIEREIAPETSLRVRYLKRKFKDQLQDVDINHSAVLWGDRPAEFPSCDDPTRDPLKPCCKRIGKFADCAGRIDSAGNPRFDGLPDLRLSSPFFNNVYLVGNFNASNYEAYVVELTRRYYQNWELQASYTWSKAIGQAEDYNSSLGDDPANTDDEVGFLSYDQRHVVKINGRVLLPYWGGIRIGAAFNFATGRPYSLITVRTVTDSDANFAIGASGRDYSTNRDSLSFGSATTRFIFPTGRRNDQRNAPIWDFNVNLQKDFRIRSMRATAQLDIFNLMNDNTLILSQIRKQEVPLPEGGFGFREFPVGFRRQGRVFQLQMKLNF